MGVATDPMRAALFGEPDGVDAINVRGAGRRESRRCRRCLVAALIFGVAVGGGVFGYWRLRMGMCTAAPTPTSGGGPRRIKWYVADPDAAQGFLLGDNPERVLNTAERVDDITGGVYHLGHQLGITPEGRVCTFLPWAGSLRECAAFDGDPAIWANVTWNTTAFAGMEMWQTVGAGRSATAGCHAALRRGDGFVDEVHRWAEAYRVAGIFVDWEWSTGNDVRCFVDLWTRVAAVLHAHGRKLAINVDNGGGEAFRWGRQTYSYMNDWGYFGFADLLVNQGTYPGPWASRTTYPVPPVGSPREAYTCEADDPYAWGFWTRCCGIKGQVRDFVLQARAGIGPPIERVEMGLWASACSADGTAMKGGGWTRESLRSWLEYAGASGVRTITVFTDNLIDRPLAARDRTCAWVVPELRRWAKT